MRRKWARRVKDYTGMMQLSCDIKPNRSVSDVFINQKMDVTELVKYLDKMKKKGEKITFFHAIVAGVGKVYYNRPYLNRFVQDRHLFEHKDVSIAFVAKVAFEDKAEEMMINQKIEPDDNIFTLSEKLAGKVSGIRKPNGEIVKKGGNNIIDVLGHWPNIFRVPVIGILKWMDKKGILPASIEEDNIYYSSIILSNLGRLHSGAIFHNITDFGNSSALGTIGEVKEEEVIINGKKQVRKLCEFGINLDERIADGYYFIKSIQLLQYIFDHPEMQMKKSKLNLSRPWVKFYKEGVNETLEYSTSSMVGYLLDAVARFPEYIAYEYYGNSVTYREFYEQIKKCAMSLKQQGVKKDEKVAICMPNTPSAIIMFYAINMVGAIATMIHPLSAQNEIELYLNQSDSAYLFVLDLVYEKVRNIIDNTNVKKVFVGSIGDNLKTIKKLLYKYKSRGTRPVIESTEDIMTYRELLNYGYGYNGEILELRQKDDPAVIIYSGGTSGEPKGILLSNLNFNALALQSHLMCDPSKEGDSLLAILPIFHGFGLGVCIHTPLCCGMKLILVPDFSPKNMVKVIKKHKPNFLCAVPSLFETLAKSTKIKKNDLECIKCAVSGGDFMSSSLKELVDKCLKEHGSSAEVRVGYGLSEASAATCLTPSGRYKPGSIGIPFPDTDYKIVKIGTHDRADINEDGEICISGPTVMMGYINNQKETMSTLREHEDGEIWLHTGDIGCMDEEGYVFFKQRLKRVIISNGYNLYPTYIEEIINSYPDVFTSTVIGIPHPKKVQVAKAYIVLKEGVKPSKEILKKIKKYLEANLSSYSIPSEYEFRDSLPKTLVGKVAYTKLEEKTHENNK